MNRILKAGLTSALSIAGGTALAEDQATVPAVWERITSICVPVMLDIDAFVDTMGDRFPEGTYGAVQSTDGQMRTWSISAGGGRFFDTFGHDTSDSIASQNCATHMISETMPDGAELSQEFEAFIAATYEDVVLRGGQMPELYADYGTGSDQLAVNEDNYFYRFQFEASGMRFDSHVQIITGFMSVWIQRAELP